MTILEHRESVYQAQAEIRSEKQEELRFREWIKKEIPAQYKEKSEILNRLGLVQIISTNEVGILDSQGNEYPFPSLENIQRFLEENKELFKTKLKQGFFELEIAPLALPLDRILKILEERILAHHKAGKFNDNNNNPLDVSEEESPIFWIEGYKDIYYYPSNFDLEYPDFKKGVMTKEQLLEKSWDGLFPGFSVFLWEENKNIPKEGNGRTIGGRKQLESNLSPNEYLDIIKNNPTYQAEIGMTIEEQLTCLITCLSKYSQMMDFYSSEVGSQEDKTEGVISCLLGNYTTSGIVTTKWREEEEKLLILIDSAKARDPVYGARTIVNLSQLSCS